MGDFKKQGFCKDYNWKTWYDTEKFLKKQLSALFRNNTFAARLRDKMDKQTSTRFLDWVDHMVLPKKRADAKTLKKLGYERDKKHRCGNGCTVYLHRGGLFPYVIVRDKPLVEVALKPENLNHCRNKLAKGSKIVGKQWSRYRKTILKQRGNYVLTAVERRGYDGFVVDIVGKDVVAYKKALADFRKRKRDHADDTKGMKYTLALVKKHVKKIGKMRTADAFFYAEREYWQKRNLAARVQKKRQDVLGLGWGNHDHHTYRCSRKNFALVIKTLEALGMLCRERFHAGKQAGWGAQVMEHPHCGIVVFADVDMSAAENRGDFSHKGLKAKRDLGTVGLWVGLHGESMLQAGMHHLEATFSYSKLVKDLKKKKVTTMAPFSSFPFLKQAFTKGERWKVSSKRARALLRGKSITKDQCDRFIRDGALGSHLENLERNGGYKGFNQNAVSVIIAKTDPRHKH